MNQEEPKQLLEEVDPENGDQSSGTPAKVAAATFGEEQRLNTLKGMLSDFYIFIVVIALILMIAGLILPLKVFGLVCRIMIAIVSAVVMIYSGIRIKLAVRFKWEPPFIEWT